MSAASPGPIFENAGQNNFMSPRALQEQFDSYLRKIPPREWLDTIPGYRAHLVVKFRDYIKLDYTDHDESILSDKYHFPWAQLYERFPKIELQRLFVSVNPERMRELLPNFDTYYRLEVPRQVDLARVVEAFAAQREHVEIVYWDPPSGDPVVNAVDDLPNAPLQTYLRAAPGGIDSNAAWQLGVNGSGEVFVDFEQGWALDHRDLGFPPNSLAGPGQNFNDSRPHGTAVLGVIAGQDNTQGIIGIAPGARPLVVSYFNATSRADALSFAIDQLGAGQILLIEAEILPGGLPVELVPAEWVLIASATSKKGITVIQAAGNGGFALALADSGAVMVGSASQTLRNQTQHVRLASSNAGNRINCYAWGEKVTTAWADKLGNAAPNDYTDCTTPGSTTCFGGTSSAAAIIAGVAILMQSIRVKQFGAGKRLNPSDLRTILCAPTNGTSVVDAAGNVTGTMPDLAKIVPICLIENPFGI